MKRLLFLCLLYCTTALIVGCTEDEVPIFGDVYGTIYNSETGEPVRNAEIILSPNNMSTVSGSDGHFEFRQLEAKQYTISVAADGYESNSRQITIIPGQSVSCDIRLKPQAVVEIFDINPLTLNFGTTQTQMAVTVTNDSKKDAQWSLDLGQNTWLKATPIAGQIGAGKSQTIVFYANRSNLSEETSGIVTFSALGGSSSLTANCSPSKQVSSIMEVTPLDIDFGDQSTEQIFRIKNKSNALLNWTIFGLESDALSVSDTSGTIQAGNAKVISIKLDRSKVQANNLVTSFMVSDGTNDQQINVNVGSHESNVTDNPDQPTAEAIGKLDLSTNLLDFGMNHTTLRLDIYNNGEATLDWSIADIQDPEIVSINNSQGTLPVGHMVNIDVSINRTLIISDRYSSSFVVTDGINQHVVTIIASEGEEDILATVNTSNIPHNQIWYTTTDGNTVTPYSASAFGVNIASNVYENGMGVITFDGELTKIVGRAFWSHTLSTIAIPDSVVEIGESPFQGCTSLSAFYGKFASRDNRCLISDGALVSFAPEGLSSYTIPNDVTKIGWASFSLCAQIKNITIPNSVISIESSAFWSCTSLETVTIPNSVENIGEYAFPYCRNLSAFYGKFASDDNRCLIVNNVLNSFAPKGLTSYSIPNNIVEIDSNTISGFDQLQTITIPSSVETINFRCLFECPSLSTVYCKSSTPPTLGGEVLEGASTSLKIHVPTASVNAYKTATSWSTYADKIVGYTF